MNRTQRVMTLVIAILATLTLGGCLNFKRQAMVIKFEEGSKKISVLMVYEGLHVTGYIINGESHLKPENLAQAKKQLESFAASEQQFCLFNNWIGHLDLKPGPDDSPRTAARKRKIAGQLKIRNGSFLENDRKELSGYQTIAIDDWDQFTKTFNDVLSDYLEESLPEILAKRKDAPKSDQFELSEPSLRKLQQAAKAGHAWLAISRGKIELRFPITREDAEKTLAEISFRATLDALKNAANRPVLAEAHEEGLRIALGDGAPVIEIQGPRGDSKAEFEDELAEHARTLGRSFDRSQNTKTLIRKFAESP